MVQTLMKFRPVFVTGTGTDVGKTYVTALLCKELKRVLDEQYLSELNSLGLSRSVSYYKAAISGAECIEQSDAGYINSFASLGQDLESLTSYLYEEAVSPHLAQKHQGSEPINVNKITQDFLKVYKSSLLTVLEGSGGIYCPLSWELNANQELTDISQEANNQSSSAMQSSIKRSCYTISDFMKLLSKVHGLGIVVVGDAALGCINNVVMTLTSLKAEGFDLKDVVVILNNYDENNAMHVDNALMISSMTKVPIIATVAKGATSLNIAPSYLGKLLTCS